MTPERRHPPRKYTREEMEASTELSKDIARRLGFESLDASISDFVEGLKTRSVKDQLTPDSLLPFGLFGTTDFEGFVEKIQEARGSLQDLEDQIRNDETLTPRDRHTLHQMLHVRKDQFYESRNQLWSQQQDEAWRLYNDTYFAVGEAISGGSLREARAILRDNQQLLRSLYLNPGVRKEIRAQFQELWERLNALGEEKREESRRRHEDWRSRQEDRLSRLRGALSRKHDQLEKVRQNLENNRNRLYAARGDFTDVVEGWIDQDEGRVDELESAINDISQTIEEIGDRLRND